ncbi:MAG TPA: SRPBCC family protein [Solirubrobacter sp.]|nr:SRPBCC family protein [Solirubrobacter sp.]
MQIDPVATAGLVAREVRSGERDGAPTKIAIARRTYRTDQADLWDAVTSAERIPRWFMPISGDLQVGGRYQLEGNAGGSIERCDEPESFAVTWEYGPMTSWLEVRFTPADDGTTLELIHEAPVDPELWGQYGPGAVGVGWDLALWGLGLYLDDPDFDKEAAAAFAASPEAAPLVREAATGWAEAAIADGDDHDTAHDAAERTVAFYTPKPEDES